MRYEFFYKVRESMGALQKINFKIVQIIFTNTKFYLRLMFTKL